ncbi:DUF3139 domain-containing protein [Metasolibacillus meyeri]|uniref:DUF3139 domain-containing protein n=1 Tax=Metasolibacillus meyeri TaxID=1071052 RepID=UPI00187D4BAA|nr:DUF3139 domain-containing protein [Metasolibacillus meyeri]
MKIKKIVFLALSLLVFSGFLYVEIKKMNLEKKVEEYLINDSGYKLQEIESIEGRFSKLPVWSVSVVFKDENNLIYHYRIEFNKVEQFSISTAKNVSESFRKSFLKKEIEFKHFEEN